MTTISPQDNPWLGLLSYGYDDSARFYGRDRELTELSELIRQNPFTTIYGLSGAGKTSIINAGLIPILDKENYLPIYIRLVHGADRMAYDEQIIQAVRNALERIEAEEELIEETKIDSELDKLWLYFHTHQFWTKDNHKITPILFIDQFEEIFTKNEDVDDVWSFFNVIDSLQYNMPTERILQKLQENDNCVTFGEEMNFRVVFSMREDFLPRLEDYCFDIPAMRRNRVGLKPLNGAQALEVIMSPRPGLVSRDVALHIISKVIGKAVKDEPRRLEATLVDTSILSLFCTELYNYGKSGEGEVSITTSLVDLYGGNILEWFYDRSMQELPRKAYEYLEDHLLTHSGFRNSVALEDLLLNNLTRSQLDRLEENRIIRIEDVGHNLRVEFTHDILCKIAKKHRDERNQEARNKSEKEAKKLFTIDTAIFMTLFGINLFVAYWTWGQSYAFVSLALLPVLSFLYLVFESRSVADKSFSQLLWLFVGIVGLGAVVIVGNTRPYEVDDKALINEDTWLMLIIPLIMLGMPLAANLREAFSNFFGQKKWGNLGILAYITLMCVTSIAAVKVVYPFPFISKEQEPLPLATFDIILLTLLFLFWITPFLILILYRRQPKRIHTVTAWYSAYCLVLVGFYAGGIWRKVPVEDIENNGFMHDYGAYINLFIVLLTLFVVFCMALFYAIQYMRQPKEKTICEYYSNIMEMQAFDKFSSFGIRFKTIGVIVLIHLVWLTSTSYIDLLPFFTLPMLVLMVLHVTRKEQRLADNTAREKRLFLLPLVALSLLMLGMQYVVISFHVLLAAFLSLIMSVLSYLYLCRKETWYRNVGVHVRSILVSLFLAFVLPFLCTGVFQFSLDLNGRARVWGGCIKSGYPMMNFLVVRDAAGRQGVMDANEVFVETVYPKISRQCWLDHTMAENAFPLIYPILCFDNPTLSDSRFVFDDYFTYIDTEGKKKGIGQRELLAHANSYGSRLASNWQHDYGARSIAALNIYYCDNNAIIGIHNDNETMSNLLSEEEWGGYGAMASPDDTLANGEINYYRLHIDFCKMMLSLENKNMSLEEKQHAVVQLFVKELACASEIGDVYNLFLQAGYGPLFFDKEHYIISNEPYAKLLQKCYNTHTLRPLIGQQVYEDLPKILKETKSYLAPLLSLPVAMKLNKELSLLDEEIKRDGMRHVQEVFKEIDDDEMLQYLQNLSDDELNQLPADYPQ